MKITFTTKEMNAICTLKDILMNKLDVLSNTIQSLPFTSAREDRTITAKKVESKLKTYGYLTIDQETQTYKIDDDVVISGIKILQTFIGSLLDISISAIPLVSTLIGMGIGRMKGMEKDADEIFRRIFLHEYNSHLTLTVDKEPILVYNIDTSINLVYFNHEAEHLISQADIRRLIDFNKAIKKEYQEAIDSSDIPENILSIRGKQIERIEKYIAKHTKEEN